MGVRLHHHWVELKATARALRQTLESCAVRQATYEVREKAALDGPMATASVVLQMNGGQVSSARVVLGHVAPTPYVAASAEKFLVGKSITADVAEQAGKEALMSAKPLSQNEYKIQLARVAVKRALLQAAKSA